MLEATEQLIDEAISIQTSKVDVAIARIVEDKQNVPIAAVLRSRFDELEKLIEIGIPISTIINALNDAGIEISNSVFRTTMSRIRTKRRKVKDRSEEKPRPATRPAPVVISKPAPAKPEAKAEPSQSGSPSRANEVDAETGRPMSAAKKRSYEVADKYQTPELKNSSLSRLLMQTAEREP